MPTDNNVHHRTAGPTACAADTETRLGGADVVFPSEGAMTITKLILHPGNEVDAKASTALLEVKVNGKAGPFKFPMFSGQGASASQGGMLPDEVNIFIHLQPGSRAGFYVTASEAHALVTCDIEFVYGTLGKETYGDLVGPTDAGATTRTRIGGATASITLNIGGPWTITEIRTALGNVVDDTETQGKLEVLATGLSDEEIGVGAGFGAATNGTTVPCQKTRGPINLPGNTAVQLWLTMQEATVDNIVGIVYS